MGGSSWAEVWTRSPLSGPALGLDVPFLGRGEVQVRTVWGELDESDGSQLLAEFLKNHHALEEGLVVQPEGDSMGVMAGRQQELPRTTPQGP